MIDRDKKDTTQGQQLHSRLVTLTVQPSPDGYGRIVLDGVYMGSSGFRPGDVVEAIVQPGLISILVPE